MLRGMSQGSTPHQPISPRASTTPLISADQRDAAAAASQDDEYKVDSGTEDKETTGKGGKRRFFGLGKRKEDKTSAPSPSTAPSATMAAPGTTTTPPPPGSNAPAAVLPRSDLKPQATPSQPQPIPVSPSRNAYPANLGASPSRLRSASPRRHSPASSEIFERNVQEPAQIAQLQGELSPAHIPAHVITEDHIPPALEASAQAITSEELNPDEVEIVMSTAHQPAASVLESSTSHADLTQLNRPLSPFQPARSEDVELASPATLSPSGGLPPATAAATSPVPGEDDGASNYGQLDPTDVRRLSFISFADVVQSEHHQTPASDIGSRDNLQAISPTATTAGGGYGQHRSNLRQPTSSPPPGVNVTSSPTLDPSPPPSSSVNLPVPASPPHNELTIETMRQAVRKTASGDLSAVRSAGLSPVSDDVFPSAPMSRTNS